MGRLNNTYLIPEVNTESFEAEISKLVSLSKKLGSGRVEVNMLGKTYEKVRHKGKEYTVGYQKYEVYGETPVLEGYSLVAKLEKQTDLGSNSNLVHHLDKNIDLPEGLSERDNYCEHCHNNRNRKHLYILQNDKTKEYIQVGKTCVKDFTGARNSPEQVARWFETIDEAEGYKNLSPNHSFKTYYKTFDVIAYSAYFTDKEGYRRTTDHTEMSPSTKWKTLEAINEKKHILREDLRKLGYFNVAFNVINWLESTNSNSEYIWNLKTLVDLKFIDEGGSGYLASAYQAYKRAKGDIKENTNEETPESEYVGNVKDRLEFSLVLKKSYQFDTNWGLMSVLNFNDEDGNVIVWKTSAKNYEEGEKVKLVGTVKEHTEYRGVKQTVITRCREI